MARKTNRTKRCGYVVKYGPTGAELYSHHPDGSQGLKAAVKKARYIASMTGTSSSIARFCAPATPTFGPKASVGFCVVWTGGKIKCRVAPRRTLPAWAR